MLEINMRTQKDTEKYIVFAVATDGEAKTERSIQELMELLDTAGAEGIAYMIQNMDKPNPVTYLGKGKVQELKECMENLEADAVICDDELSPVQHRNLADALDAKVVDRTILILDIFAGRATTREGKIQVEMAQLKYRATRLTGKGTALSRLGAGIGTRGPGETKLEIDRRNIRDRIAKLSSDIKDVEKSRATARKKRQDNSTPIVAIVGYTNAGKSTLLNHLTEAEVLAEDKLFATLDPITRMLKLPGGQEVLMTDTVGFINKLPHHLIDAFKSTLEEAKYADIILHVVDASEDDETRELKMKVVYDTLESLGIKDKPVITAFNKIDLREDSQKRNSDGSAAENLNANDLLMIDGNADRTVQISALTGKGIPELFGAIDGILKSQRKYIETIIPYADSGSLAKIRKYGQIISEEYVETGTEIKAYVPNELNFALQYSNKMEVMEPASVRREIKKRLKDLNEKYK